MAKKAGRLGLLVWLATLIAPPVLAGELGRQFVARDPVLSIVIVVAYEVIAAVAGFLSGVVGKTASKWQDRLADRLDLAIWHKVSPFERRYRKFVLAGLRFIDLKGLATIGPFTPELDAVFVDVSLVPRPPQQIHPGVLPELAADRTGRRALEDFLGRQEAAVLAVVGAPGSGKTTLLRHTARQACLRSGSVGERSLPILLYLRDHVTAITADPYVSLTALLRGTLGDLAAAEPDKWFERKLRSGECVVLLDGLDEVARKEDRRTVARWAERQISLYDGNDFVITSRPHGYQAAGIEGAEVLEVCGFTAAQVDRFVRGWYLAVERHGTGDERGDIEARARSGADDLLRRLEQAPGLHDLTVNPLLLTMIANVHRYRGQLPGSHAKLYAEVCQAMLWRRQEAKNLASEMSGDKKETVLRGLAYAMMRRRRPDLSRDDVLAEIEPALRELPQRVSAESFLADIGSSGLLIERETEREAEWYSFAHQTFQEYLAAAHIRDNRLASVLADNVSDPWWRETTLLYAARGGTDPIVAECLRAGTATALALAFDCADQDGNLDAGLRVRLDSLLSSAWELRAAPEYRALVARVLLTRHLRQLVGTADGSRVCVKPVTGDLVRLCAHSAEGPSPIKHFRSSEVSASGASVGMSGSAAADFAYWASEVVGGAATYRLPGRDAMDELARRKLLAAAALDGPCAGVWVRSDAVGQDAAPELWVPPGQRHPYQVEAAILAECVAGDFARLDSEWIGILLWRALEAARMISGYLEYARRIDDSMRWNGRHARTGRGARAGSLARDLGAAIASARDLLPEIDRLLGLAGKLASPGGIALGHVPGLLEDLAKNLGRESEPYAERRHARWLYSDRPGELEAHRAGFRAQCRIADCERAQALVSSLNDFVSPFGSFGGAGSFVREAGQRDAFVADADRRRAASLDDRCADAMGTALSAAFARVLGGQSAPRDWVSALSAAFAREAGIGADQVVAPAALDDKLRQVLRRFLPAHLAKPDHREQSAWAIGVAGSLGNLAGPVFSGWSWETVSPGRATSLMRLQALCLAGEADRSGDRELGDQLREIAAGITLLERRATGAQPAAEIILLAVE